MEQNIKPVPWHRDISVSTADRIEDLIGIPREGTMLYECIDRFKLDNWSVGMPNFRPHLVGLSSLSPRSVRERLMSVGLVPATLRQYLSLRQSVENYADNMNQGSFVYVGEFIQDSISQNWWKTFSFFQKGDEYEGMLSCMFTHDDSFLSQNRLDRDYIFTRYAVAVPIK